MTCKKALIYVNISYDGWIIKCLSSGRDFIERSVVHILDNHTLFIYIHDDTNVPIRWRKTRSMVDDDCTRFWCITCWYSLFTRIFYPFFCISSPGYIFIFCNKTCTVSPSKISTSFCDLEVERISSIAKWLRIIRCIFLWCHFFG